MHLIACKTVSSRSDIRTEAAAFSEVLGLVARNFASVLGHAN
jgi:hypothetical protein